MQNNLLYFGETGKGERGVYYDFHISDTFYLLAPSYYYPFYAQYIRGALQVYDGYQISPKIMPQRIVQSVSQGLSNIIFAHGIDFAGDKSDYEFMRYWAKNIDLYSTLKQADLFSYAGGTSILKLNRKGTELYITSHRIDYFYPVFANDGTLISCRIYYDLTQNFQDNMGNDFHYGICEERYYDDYGIAVCRHSIYRTDGNVLTEMLQRPTGVNDNSIKWENLEPQMKKYVHKMYPDIVYGKPMDLPFGHSLGIYVLRFSKSIPQAPNLNFGQPIGDILFEESRQFDKMKYFENTEIYLARGRILVPEDMINKDDPDYDSTMDEMVYSKVSSVNTDNDKPTPVQFQLRASEMRIQKENIYRDISAKLNVSTSTIASFLSEGSGAKTATEIQNHRTETDTWISNRIEMIQKPINDMLADVCRYFEIGNVEIVFKSEEQTPILETAKTYSDMFTVGNISPKLFVKKVHKNLTEKEQQEEIAYLEEQVLNKKKQAEVTPMPVNMVSAGENEKSVPEKHTK